MEAESPHHEEEIPHHFYELAARWLREDLIDAREALGWTRESLGARINTTERTIARFENGFTPIRQARIEQLCRAYDLTQERCDELRRMQRLSQAIPWWNQHRDIMNHTYRDHCELEEQAITIDMCENIVPGFLQTDAYAERVQKLSHQESEGERAQRFIEIRKLRREEFERRAGKPIRLIMHISMLQMPWSADLIGEQLSYLTQLHDDRRLQFRVINETPELLPIYPFSLFRVGPKSTRRHVICESGYVAEKHFEATSRFEDLGEYFDRIWDNHTLSVEEAKLS